MAGPCHIFVLVMILNKVACSSANYSRFPDDFVFGVGTSAFQIEGAWNVSGKGESIWDRATHTTSYIAEGATADIACDSYHRHEDDVLMLRQLRVHCYRFSISWTRLFPNGTVNHASRAGVDYYNRLIDDLTAAGVEPMVTLFHWDTPQTLEDLGGWTTERMIVWFAEYADAAFALFGDRVRVWTTFNEPANYCQFGYDLRAAPFRNSSGIGSYLCAHNIIRAHAEVYHLYQQKYRDTQNGVIGISLDSFWYEPAEETSEEDQRAAEIALEFYFGWFAWPIFKTGNYPESMRAQIGQRSREQGFTHSRLPAFTTSEKLRIKNSADFLGLNHYATFLIKFDNQSASATPSKANDRNLVETVDPSWGPTTKFGFTVRPESMRKLLLWIGKRLGQNVRIAITESGYNGDEEETLDDPQRVDYLNRYVQAVLDALNQGANVGAFTWWSLMDNFEWTDGYTRKFGLYHVDFNDPKRPRTAKKSAMVYQNIITTKRVDPTFDPRGFVH